MDRLIAIPFAILCLLGLGTVLWRVCSRRRELPCPVWLHWMVELDNPLTKTTRARFLVEHLSLEPGLTVLDAGCGPGRLTIPIAEKVGPAGRVLAMDLQEGMLSRVREKAREKNLENIDFLHAGLGRGMLESNRFDRALLVSVLGEIPDREKALHELFEALRPDGVLGIVETVFDPHYQRRATVCCLAEEAGFQKKESFGNKIAYAILFQKPHRQTKGTVVMPETNHQHTG